jgi:hypothetical protein
MERSGEGGASSLGLGGIASLRWRSSVVGACSTGSSNTRRNSASGQNDSTMEGVVWQRVRSRSRVCGLVVMKFRG